MCYLFIKKISLKNKVKKNMNNILKNVLLALNWVIMMYYFLLLIHNFDNEYYYYIIYNELRFNIIIQTIVVFLIYLSLNFVLIKKFNIDFYFKKFILLTWVIVLCLLFFWYNWKNNTVSYIFIAWYSLLIFIKLFILWKNQKS